MALDQTKLGEHISAQMEAIEQDPGISDDAQIGDIVTIVEVLVPNPDNPEEVARNVRVRATGMPHVGIGLLEEAKAMQIRMGHGG